MVKSQHDQELARETNLTGLLLETQMTNAIGAPWFVTELLKPKAAIAQTSGVAWQATSSTPPSALSKRLLPLAGCGKYPM